MLPFLNKRIRQEWAGKAMGPIRSRGAQRKGLAVAAAVALTALAAPAGASAAVTCDLTMTGALDVEVTDGTQFVYLSRELAPGTDVLVDTDNVPGNGTVACTGGPPTLTTTREVNVDETPSTQSTALFLNFERGRLEPGLGTDEGTAEIEVNFNTDTDGGDSVQVIASDETAAQSFRFGASGPDIGGELNGDDDGDDLTLVDVQTLGIQPGDGNDVITFDGTGSSNYSGPAPAPSSVSGSQGNDTVAAGTGSQNDFAGGPDDDTFIGGPNTDRFNMEEGNDTFDGAGGGGDVASYEGANSVDGATLDLSRAGPQDTVGFGTDQVANVEIVVGSNGPDELTGTNGPNIIFGGTVTPPGDTGADVLAGLGGADQLIGRAGDDVLGGGPGDDQLVGEEGTDTATFALGSTGPVSFDLDFALTGVAQATGGAGSDTLADSNLGPDPDSNHEVENIVGSAFADALTGNVVGNRINALDGLTDTVNCVGPANGNVAVSDEVGVDAVSNCETTDNAPQTSVTSGPTNGTVTASPNHTYGLSSDEPATFQYSVDGGAFTTCPASCAVTGLGNGAHTIAFRAVDADENLSPDQTPATRTLTVDTAAPETSIVSGPKAKTKQRTASFAFASSEPGSTFLCRFDGAAYTACTSPTAKGRLSKGVHRFDVLATDSLGNRDQSAATRIWKVVKRKRKRR